MVNRLDQLDLSIIRQLQFNGRSTLSEIAKKVKSSRQTVQIRLKRLLEEGLLIIKGTLDFQKLGFKVATVGLEVKTEESRKIVEEYLANCPRVLNIFRTAEKANIHLSMWGEDDQTINSTIESFRDLPNVDIIDIRYLGTPIHGSISMNLITTQKTKTPCGQVCSDCTRYSDWCTGCPVSLDYKLPFLNKHTRVARIEK